MQEKERERQEEGKNRHRTKRSKNQKNKDKPVGSAVDQAIDVADDDIADNAKAFGDDASVTSAPLRHARKHAALLRLGLVGQRLALELVRLPVRVLTRGVAIVPDAAPLALGVRAHRRLDGRARGARARRERGLDLVEESACLFEALAGGELAELVGELGVLWHAFDAV